MEIGKEILGNMELCLKAIKQSKTVDWELGQVVDLDCLVENFQKEFKKLKDAWDSLLDIPNGIE